MAKNLDKLNHDNRTKKYPIRCIECGAKAVRPAVVHERVEKSHDGRHYDLDIHDLPVTMCDSCNEIFYSQASDDRISDALRSQIHLLAPSQIRENIGSLQLSQKRAAELLGVAPETLSRWLSGAMIQSRAMDNLLRAFFGCPGLRENLQHPSRVRRLGETVVTQEAADLELPSSLENFIQQVGRPVWRLQSDISEQIARQIRNRGTVLELVG